MDLEYNDVKLYTQLCYFQHIFDAKKALSSLQPSDKDKVQSDFTQTLAAAYTKLMNHVQQTLLQSAYSEVNLAGLFAGLVRPKNEALSVTIKD